MSSPSQTWTFLVLPYLEQVPIYNAANMNQPAYAYSNMTVVQARLGVFDCPSDPLAGATWISHKLAAYPNRSKGNYVVNWGNSDFEQNMTPASSFAPANLGAFGSVMSIRGPFRVNNPKNAIQPFRFRDIIDGTTNTMMASELKLVADLNNYSDARGDVWCEGTKCGYVYTAATPPNSDIWDQLDGKSGCPNPSADPPCYQASGAQREFNAARSHHSGGVNVVFCDGSVRFIKDSINLAIWRALSTKDGNEIVSADAY